LVSAKKARKKRVPGGFREWVMLQIIESANQLGWKTNASELHREQALTHVHGLKERRLFGNGIAYGNDAGEVTWLLKLVFYRTFYRFTFTFNLENPLIKSNHWSSGVFLFSVFDGYFLAFAVLFGPKIANALTKCSFFAPSCLFSGKPYAYRTTQPLSRWNQERERILF